MVAAHSQVTAITMLHGSAPNVSLLAPWRRNSDVSAGCLVFLGSISIWAVFRERTGSIYIYII